MKIAKCRKNIKSLILIEFQENVCLSISRKSRLDKQESIVQTN